MFDEYAAGYSQIEASTLLFFALNDDFTPNILFGRNMGIAIAAFTAVAGLAALLLPKREQKTPAAPRPWPMLLVAMVLMYALPIPFAFTKAGFAYFIIHSGVLMPVVCFAFSLYLARHDGFRWFLPLLLNAPMLVLLPIFIVDFSFAAYAQPALYTVFAYLGMFCALAAQAEENRHTTQAAR